MARLGSAVVLFIDRNRIQLYRSDTGGLYVVDIPETIIKDLEIRDAEGLFALIGQWIARVGVPPAPLVCIVGEALCFSKDLPAAEDQPAGNQSVSFLDHVPFEAVVSRVYEIEKGKRVIAVNSAVCELVQRAFTAQGFSVRAFVPVGALGGKTIRLLDAEIGSWAVKNTDTLIRQSIAAPQVVEKLPQSAESAQKKSSLPILLGAFGLLVMLLVIVLILRR